MEDGNGQFVGCFGELRRRARPYTRAPTATLVRIAKKMLPANESGNRSSNSSRSTDCSVPLDLLVVVLKVRADAPVNVEERERERERRAGASGVPSPRRLLLLLLLRAMAHEVLAEARAGPAAARTLCCVRVADAQRGQPACAAGPGHFRRARVRVRPDVRWEDGGRRHCCCRSRPRRVRACLWFVLVCFATAWPTRRAAGWRPRQHTASPLPTLSVPLPLRVVCHTILLLYTLAGRASLCLLFRPHPVPSARLATWHRVSPSPWFQGICAFLCVCMHKACVCVCVCVGVGQSSSSVE